MAPKNPVDEEMQALIEQADQPPPARATRNINYDVHQGYAPQRPYAALEDRMGQLQGARSTPFEDLPPQANAKRDPQTGDWYREVPYHTGSSVMKDGRLHFVMRMRRRPIARTQQEARASNADWWNGATWVRNGVKPEADHPVNAGTDATAVGDEFLEPASAAEQAAARAEADARLSTKPAIPDAPAGMEVRKADAKAEARSEARAGSPAEGKES